MDGYHEQVATGVALSLSRFPLPLTATPVRWAPCSGAGLKANCFRVGGGFSHLAGVISRSSFFFLCTLQLEWNEPSVNSASFCRLEQNDVFLCPATPSVNPASFCQLQQNEVFLGPVPRHGFYLPSVSLSRTKSFSVQLLHQWIQLPSVSLSRMKSILVQLLHQ